MPAVDLAPEQAAKGHSCGAELAPFLADPFALGVIHRRQEVGEVAVAGIGPMELHAVAQQHAGSGAGVRFVGLRKQNMQRRQMVFGNKRQCAREKLAASRGVGRDQPRPRRRRKRNRAHELGIVMSPVPPVRVGPRPVEHVFAVGVRLDVERHRANEQRAVPRSKVARRPPCLRRRATGFVQRVQKRVRQKRPIADKRIPGRRGDRAERVDDAKRGACHAREAIPCHCRMSGKRQSTC